MKRIGQYLVELGWITKQDLARALQSQEVLGGSLGTCLVEMKILTEERLLKALAHQVGVDAPRIQELRNIPHQVFELVPAKLAVRCQAVPFRMLGGELYVAMSDVQNLTYQDEIAFATGKSVRPFIAPEARIFEALAACYGHECPPRYRQLLNALNTDQDPAAPPPQDPGLSLDSADLTDPSVPRGNGDRAARPTGVYRTQQLDSSGAASFEELERSLTRSQDTHEVGCHVLQYLENNLDSVALFMVKRDEVVGWMGQGEGLDQDQLRQFRIDFGQPSVFLNLRQGGLFYTGPLPSMAAHRSLARCWGGELPKHCLVLPVRVQERLVTVIIGDPGTRGITGLNLEQMQHLSARTADALGNCILRNKQRQV